MNVRLTDAASHARCGASSADSSATVRTRAGWAALLAAVLVALPIGAQAQQAAPGDGLINLTWTPAGVETVILMRAGAPVGDVPVNGTVYQPFTYDPTNVPPASMYDPTLIGASTVVFAGTANLTSVTSIDGLNPLTNGTQYYFRLYSRAANGTYTALGNALGPIVPAQSSDTVVTLIPDPASAALNPGGPLTILDNFGLSNLNGDTVTSATISLSPAGAYAALQTVALTTNAGAVIASVTNPTANVITFPGLSLVVTSVTTTYNIRIQPKAHVDMPAPPGATYPVTGVLASLVTGKPRSGADGATTVLTIDNASPANPNTFSAAPNSGSVALSWVNPVADFASVVVLRGSAPITDKPVEGVTTYAAGQTIGAATVAYAGNGTSTSVTGLTNGTGYYFKIFARDALGNYSLGLEFGPVIPGAGATVVGNTSKGTQAPVVAIVNPLGGARIAPARRIVNSVLTPLLVKVQVRVSSPAAAIPLNGVVLRRYSGPPTAPVRQGLAQNTKFGASATSGIWETPADFTLPAGTWTLDVEVTTTGGITFSNPVTVTVVDTAPPVGLAPQAGDGHLLVRDNSAQLCGDCHALATHSSEGQTNYGSWSTACRDCHTPHGTRNVYLVAENITPPQRGAGGATTSKPVAFSTTEATGTITGNATGARTAASYVNTDATGPCQVCHTLTRYYRADGTSPAGGHQTGTRCTDCHPHSQGMAVNCTACHGLPGRVAAGGVTGTNPQLAVAPPRGALGQTLTSDPAVGAHQAHVNANRLRRNALTCAECHPATPNHNGTVDFQFGLLGNGTLASVPLNPQYNADLTCSSTWCHGNGLNAGGTNNTPTWNQVGTGQAACGTCHGAPPLIGHPANNDCNACHPGYALTGITGVALDSHIDGFVNRPGAGACTGCHGSTANVPVVPTPPGVDAAGIQIAPPRTSAGSLAIEAHKAHTNERSLPVACADCHGQLPVDLTHMNGAKDVSLIGSVLANQGGGFAVYTGTTCNSVYCHGATFSAAAKGSNTTPLWTDVLTCGSCHGAPPGDALHASVTTALSGCNACHPETVDAAGNIIAAVTGTPPNTIGGVHVDGIIQSKFTKATSCTDCHGDGARVASEEAVFNFQAAPPKAVAPGVIAETDVRVGAHVIHVNNGVRARAVLCDDCHDGSAAFEDFSPNYNTLWLHANGTVEVAFPAAAPPSYIARAGGVAATYARGTTNTCANYCHGATASPAWNNPANLACTSCHGAPPPYTAPGGFHVTNTNCGACHTGFTATSVTLTAAKTHVDGKVDLSSPLSCSSCHGDASTAFVATDGAPATSTTNNRVGAHAAHAVAGPLAASIGCADCHGVLPAAMNHANGLVNIGWSAVASTGFTPTPAAGTIPVNSAQTCTNYCHGSTLTTNYGGSASKSVSWTATSAAVACGTCHFVNASTLAVGATHPRNDTAATPITLATQCVQCHPDTMNATGGTINFAGGKHVNGIGEVSGGHVSPYAPAQHSVAFFANQAGCTACHGVNYDQLVTTFSGVSGSCTSCHTNPTPFGAPYVGGTANAQWATDCTYCHGNAARAADPAYATAGTPARNLVQIAPPDAVTDGQTSTTFVRVGAHQKHFTTTSSPKVACQACHGPTLPTAANVMAHVNGTVALGWNTVATNNGAIVPSPAGTFFPAGFDASPTCTNYCHGATGAGLTGGTITSPRWNVAADGACGTCHFVTNTAAPTATAAENHFNHVNQAAVIGANFVCQDCHSTVVNAAGQLLAAANTLHVNGTDTVSMLNRGTQSNGTYVAGSCAASYCHSSGQATPTFRSVAWNSATDMGCNGCHGTGNAAGAPDYASGAAGSATANDHAAHTGAGASSCQNCHSGLVTAAGTAIAGALHINGTREVAILLAYDSNGAGTSNYNTATKTCSSVNCHGTGAPQWGAGPLKCSDCHAAAGAGADVDSFAFGTVGIISTTEWAASGHGQAAGALFTAGTVLPTIAAGQPCLYCHDSSVTHSVAGNPFRLHGATIAGGTVVPGSYNAAGPNAGNDVCLNCHSATGAGIAPNAQALRTATNKTTARHVGAKHGATNDGGTRCWDCHDAHGDANIRMVGKKVVRDSNDLHGFSATRVPAGNVSFTANTAATNFISPTTGICNVCHVTALHYTAAASDTHNNTTVCTTCHTHEQAPTSAFSAGASHASPYPAAQHSVDFVANQTSCQGCHGATYATLVPTTGGSGSCNTCHANPAAFGATYAGGVANANWQTDCTFCHGSTGTPADAAYATAGTPARNLNQISPPQAFTDGVTSTTFVKVGAHQKHFTTTSAPKTQCTACHGATIPPNLTHANASVALGWSTVSTGNGAVTPTPAAFNAAWEAAPTCTNYCHGAAGSGMTGGTITSPRWNVAADGACGTCHFVTNTAAPTATAAENHFNHVNQAAVIGANFVCQDCHSTVVNAAGQLLAAANTLHVNGTDTVSMLARAGRSNGTYVAGSCAASYCHSSGQATPTFRSVAWNSATDMGCNGCHGTGNAAGAPDYASGAAGSATANDHAAHTGAGASSCQNCHSGLVTAAGTAIAGALHINGTREVAILLAYDSNGAGTSNYNTATKTCSSVNCHGTGAPQWGAGPLKCSDCHAAAGAGADVDSFAFGTVGIISTTEWAASGHGQAAGALFTAGTVLPTIAAGQPCLYCHDSSVTHSVAGNPFRLHGATIAGGTVVPGSYNAAGPNAGNDVCLNCHSATGAGIAPNAQALRTATNKTTARHVGAKHGATNDGGTRCWDCHDAHGDANIRMVGKKVVRDSNDLHGFSATRVPAGNVSFTANTAATNFISPTTGICNVCHVTALHYTAAASDTHNNTTVCTTCHTHEQAPTSAFSAGASHASPYPAAQHSVDFVANQTSCQGCHGATYATLVPTTGGSGSCNTCHANPAAFGATYAGGVANANWQTDCTFCHGSTGTPADAAYATAGTPARNLNQISPPQAFTDGVTSTTFVKVGAHQKHFTTTSAPKTQCTACHGATIPPNLTHANASVALGWSTVSTGNGAVTPTPAAFNAAWEAAPTCTNYCHGAAGSGMTGGTITSPRWNVAADGACGTCHFATNTAAPTATAAENHFNHVNQAAVIGANFVCQDCHSTVVNAAGQLLAAANTLHVNGTDTVSMLNRGTQSNGTYVAGSCAASYCHSSGQATPTFRSVAWNSATDMGCNGCHGTGNAAGAPDYASGAAGSATANDHAAHTGAGASSCQNCHSGLVTAAGTAIAGALHINGTREVAILLAYDSNGAGTSNYNTATKTCSSVNCHGTGTPQWGGAALKCSDCHAAAGTGADVDSFAFGTAGIISTTEWAASGHGQPVGALFTAATVLPTIAAGQPCLYCHDNAVVHDLTTNPFRLRGASLTGGATFNAYNGASANNGNEVCLNCHGTGSFGVNAAAQGLKNGTLKVDSWHAGAKHTTNNGGRRCWDCHDAHGDANIQMVGKKVVRTSADNYSFSATRVPAGATNVIFTARTTGTNFTSPTTGICNVCHTTANHYTAAASDTHNSTTVCTTCHAHDQAVVTDAFAPAGGGDCLGCHGSAQGARREVISEFRQVWSHKASTNVATPASRTVTTFDCAVCHMEGDPATGNMVGAFHANGYINLRNPDTGLHIKGVTFTLGAGPGSYASTAVDLSFTQFRRNLASATLEPAVTAVMINQCLACHDSNGAAVTRVPVASGGTAEKPFGVSILRAGTYVGVGVTANGRQGAVTDINASFAVTNSSYHPVRGAQNNWYAKLTRMVAPWNATRGATVNLTSWGSLLSCWDCHASVGATGTITQTLTAHGGSVTLRGTATASGTPGATATGEATLCKVCHLGYTTNTGNNHGANSAFTSSTNGGMTTYLRYGCNACHASNYSTAVVRPVRAIDVHGVNTLPAGGLAKASRWATANAVPYAFIRNTTFLTNHSPQDYATTNGTSGTCSSSAGNPCSDGMGTYTVGGTY